MKIDNMIEESVDRDRFVKTLKSCNGRVELRDRYGDMIDIKSISAEFLECHGHDLDLICSSGEDRVRFIELIQDREERKEAMRFEREWNKVKALTLTSKMVRLARNYGNTEPPSSRLFWGERTCLEDALFHGWLSKEEYQFIKEYVPELGL